jgi:hypothetical protein
LPIINAMSIGPDPAGARRLADNLIREAMERGEFATCPATANRSRASMSRTIRCGG